MYSKLISKIIKKNDEVVSYVVRKSLWSRFWSILIAIVFVNLPFFLLYPLFQYGLWGVVSFSVILVLAILFLFRIYIIHYYTALLVTDKRLVDVERAGFFSRSVNSIAYIKIQDVNYKSKGILKSIFKIGDVYITFIGDNHSIIKLESVKHPDDVVGRIIQMKEHHQKEKRKSSNTNAVRLLKRIKRRVGEARFNQLISD